MKKEIDITKIKLRCMIDAKLIPMERILRRSGTCCKECQGKLRKIRLAIINSRKCLRCFKPSTPEERLLYKRFKLQMEKEGKFTRPKHGRPRKKPEDGIPQAV